MNIVQLVFKAKDPYKPIFTYWDEKPTEADIHKEIIIINFIVLAVSTVKIFRMLKMYPSIANQMALLVKCFEDIVAFFCFFQSFVLMLAGLFKLAGTKFDFGDYPEVTQFLQYYLQGWRNSIGDIQPPAYDFWNERIAAGAKEGENTAFEYFMIYTIWLIFIFFNVILLLIILLNCLVAIVGESFSIVMAEKTNNIYQFRSLLNLEYIEILGVGVFKTYFNQILLISSISDSSAG